MSSFFSRYATPLTTGLFVVSLISGIALFFHWQSGWFREMHEWLSMVLIAPFALHLWKNWRAFVAYFRRPPMMIATALSLVAAVAFAVPAAIRPAGGGNPLVAVSQAIESASLESVAPIFGHTSESLTQALVQQGYTVATPSARIADIARASGKTGREAVAAIGRARIRKAG